jgi:PAS domain S-box-containing protein
VNYRRNVLFFIVGVSVLLAGTALTSIYRLYRRSVVHQNTQLEATVRAQAHLIESLARQSAIRGPENWRAEALVAIEGAYRDLKVTAQSEETVLARIDGDSLDILLRYRGGRAVKRSAAVLSEAWTEPYRLAMRQEFGVWRGFDRQGHRVLVGYGHVRVLDAVLISQIDMADVRLPFERAALQSGAMSLLVVLLGVGLFTGVVWPMVLEVEGSRDRFRQAVEASPSGFIMANQRGRILMVNKMARKLFGYTQEEFLNLGIEDLLPERFRAAHGAQRRGYHGHPESRAMGRGRDLVARRKDGSEFPVEIGLNPIAAAEGRLVLAAIVDISDRHRLQKQLTQKESLAAVGEMAAVVAHEIRNPLGSIVTAAKSLAGGDLDKEDRKSLLDVMASETERLNKTISDFLVYARPRDLDRKTADLGKLVGEVLASVRAEAEVSSGVTITESFATDLSGLRFDQDMIRQVVWNLVLNGIQAAGTGGTMAVVIERKTDEVLLRVGDSGAGVSAEARERIFKPFFTTKKQGTGLGLAISSRIVIEHGGRLELVDSPLGGAEFVVALPINPA